MHFELLENKLKPSKPRLVAWTELKTFKNVNFIVVNRVLVSLYDLQCSEGNYDAQPTSARTSKF